MSLGPLDPLTARADGLEALKLRQPCVEMAALAANDVKADACRDGGTKRQLVIGGVELHQTLGRSHRLPVVNVLRALVSGGDLPWFFEPGPAVQTQDRVDGLRAAEQQRLPLMELHVR